MGETEGGERKRGQSDATKGKGVEFVLSHSPKSIHISNMIQVTV